MRAILLILFISCTCLRLQAQDIITTVAGNGIIGYCCDSEQATVAEIADIEGLCLDNFGNLYITDDYSNRIRKVNLSTGIITTVAGNGNKQICGEAQFQKIAGEAGITLERLHFYLDCLHDIGLLDYEQEPRKISLTSKGKMRNTCFQINWDSADWND